jgi:hypothetical protein
MDLRFRKHRVWQQRMQVPSNHLPTCSIDCQPCSSSLNLSPSSLTLIADQTGDVDNLPPATSTVIRRTRLGRYLLPRDTASGGEHVFTKVSRDREDCREVDLKDLGGVTMEINQYCGNMRVLRAGSLTSSQSSSGKFSAGVRR